MAKHIDLNVNGKARTVEAEPDMPLLYALRDNLEMKEPRFGCGLAQCGACAVLLNGVPTRSCVTPVGAKKSPRLPASALSINHTKYRRRFSKSRGRNVASVGMAGC